MLFIEFANGGEYSVQATVSFGRDLSADSTNYRVEKGADVTDHIENAPLTLDISGVMGTAPLTATGAYKPGQAGVHTEFDERMIQAWNDKELLIIDSEGRDVYENMQIQSYSTSSDSSTGYSIVFSLSLKQIRYVDSKFGRTSSAQAENRPTARRFSDPRGTGIITPVPASTNQIAIVSAI